MFLIKANIPVVESFGIYTELQIITSGKVNAQMQFSGFKIVNDDPLYKPSEQEIEDFGE